MKASLIGCGAISVQHASALQTLGIELAAVCDAIQERARTLCARYAPRARVFTDYRRMLDETDTDSVHVCTPHYLHEEMIVAALRRGRHVLTEKPLAIGLESLARIEAAASGANKTFGVCLQNRYLESSRETKRLCDAHLPDYAFGSVIWSRGAEYYTASDWRGRLATEGGGVLTNQAIHTLDLLIWCMGMPAYVTATIYNRHLRGVIEVEDTAEIYLEFDDGRRAQFYATTAASVDMPVRIAFAGKKNIVLEADTLTVDGRKIDCSDRTARIAKDCWGKGHLALIDDFYKKAAAGKSFPIDAREGGKVVRVLRAVYAGCGERVRVI